MKTTSATTQHAWKSALRPLGLRAALLLLLATFAQAQDSQFSFDLNGNLIAQTEATSALPQIIGQPRNQMGAPGEALSFSVIVADPRALSYQWQFNGTDITGENGDSLVLANVSASNEGEYRVVLTNPSGSVTSAPAMLWIDSRGVGMPDSWQLFSFDNLNQLPNGDFDRDGASNLQEFLDGTDPTDTDSVRFHLTVVRDGGSVLTSPDLPSYANGQSVTLTASAFPGGEPFHAWLGDVVSRENPLTLVMTNNKTIYARFTPIPFFWSSPINGDWETATNWTPNVGPGVNDSVVIASSVTVTLNTAADCAAVILGSFSSPTLTGNGTLTIREGLFWSAGTMSGSGRTILETNALLNTAGGVSLNTRTLENRGTVLWTGTGPTFLTGAVITNRAGALFEAQNAVDFIGVTSRFDNAGTFRKSLDTGTMIVSGMAFNNYGTVEVQAGTLDLGGGGTSSGSVELSEGATLKLSGGTYAADEGSSMTGAGQFTVSGATATLAGVVNVSGSNTFSAGTANVTGTYIGSNNVITVSGGTLNVTGICTFTNNTVSVSAGTANLSAAGSASPAILNLSSGTLTGTTTLTVNNVMNWTGGTMSGSGQTIIQPGATLNLGGTTPAFLQRTLENAGTVIWTGVGGIAMSTGAVITNRAGALFNARNAAFLSLGSGASRFDNAGIFRKSANTGTTTVDTPFNNFGLVEIQTGGLNLKGGGTHSGGFDLLAGASLALSGTHGADQHSSLTGAGQLTVSGGTATLGGLVNVTGTNNFTGGTVNLTGNYIASNNVVLVSGGAVNATGNCVVTNNTVTVSGGAANFSGPGFVSPSILNLSSGILTGTSPVTINNVMNWTGGIMSGGGRTIIGPGGTLNAAIPLFASLTGRTLENGGTTLWTGAGSIDMSSGAVITNRVGALFNAQNSAALTSSSGANRFDNAGTFRKSVSTGTMSLASILNNTGVIEIQAGILLCNGTFTNHGAVILSAGTTNRLAAGGFASGTFNAAAAAMVEWTANNFVLGTGAQLSGAGLYRINFGSLAVNTSLAIENLDLFNGLLDGAGTVTVMNVMNWTGGGMTGSGRTIVDAGATLNAAIPFAASLITRTLENGGTILWSGAGSIDMSTGAVITNRPGSLFHIQNAAALGSAFGGRIDNAGIFRKSVSSASSPVNVPFTNYALMDIRTGILAANGGYASSGSAVLNCALGGTTPGSGYGQLQVAGTVTLNGGLSVDLLPGFIPEKNDSFTVLAAGTRNGTFASVTYPSNQVTLQLNNTGSSVVLKVTGVDFDSDGIPDDWEAQSGLDSNNPADADLDFDGDGFSNRDEYRAGTDPRDSRSALRIVQVDVNGSAVSIWFNSVAGRSYTIEYNDDFPVGPWQTLIGFVSGAGGRMEEPDAPGLTISNRIYRVKTVGPDGIEVPSELAGYRRITLLANSDTLLSIPFLRPAAELAAVASISGSNIQVTGVGAWSPSQWVYGASSNSYYLLIRSGAREGDSFSIIGNGPDTVTLDLEGGSLTGVSAGDSVAIIPYWTLGTIFPAGFGVNASPTLGTRLTEIVFPDLNGTGVNLSAARTYYFWSGAWRQVGQGIGARNDDAILADMFLWVRQNTSSSTEIVTLGSVLSGKWRLYVRRNLPGKQDNFLALPRALPFSLDASRLFESGAARTSSSSTDRIDELFFFDNTTTARNKAASAIYYRFGGAWRRVGSGGVNVGGDAVFIPGIGAILRAGADSGPAIWTSERGY